MRASGKVVSRPTNTPTRFINQQIPFIAVPDFGHRERYSNFFDQVKST